MLTPKARALHTGVVAALKRSGLTYVAHSGRVGRRGGTGVEVFANANMGGGVDLHAWVLKDHFPDLAWRTNPDHARVKSALEALGLPVRVMDNGCLAVSRA